MASAVLKTLLSTLAAEGPGLLKEAGTKILTKALLGGKVKGKKGGAIVGKSWSHIVPHLAPQYVKAAMSGGSLGAMAPEKLFKGLHPMKGINWSKGNKPMVKGTKVHFKAEHFGTGDKHILLTKPQMEKVVKGDGDLTMTMSPRQRHANAMMKGGGFFDSLWSGVKKLGSVVTDVGTKVGSTVAKQGLKGVLGTTGALGDLITQPLGIGKLSNITDKLGSAGGTAVDALGDATNRGFHAALGEGLKKRKRSSGSRKKMTGGGVKAKPKRKRGGSIKAAVPKKQRKAIQHVTKVTLQQFRQGHQGAVSANRPPLPGNSNLIPNVLVA